MILNNNFNDDHCYSDDNDSDDLDDHDDEEYHENIAKGFLFSGFCAMGRGWQC